MRDTKVLFDESSIHATDYSLRFFSFRHQATIQAVDLPEDGEITFEIIRIKAGTPDELCGCFIQPGEMPQIIGAETLLCFGCDDEGIDSKPVKVTADNPVVVLNAPQNAILRAKYDGDDIGSFNVWATIETDTQELLPGQDGCVDCCEPDPDSWQETGERRCNLDDDKLEALMVDNCGNEEWQEIGDLNWQDTGDFRCDDDKVEKKQVNDCGDIRWEEDGDNEWKATGEFRCVDITDDEDTYTVELQEEDRCGNLRWEKEKEREWKDTGEIRCVDEDTVEKQQETICGHVRWVEDDKPNEWVETGEVHCSNITDDEDTYTIRHKEIDRCGNIRWSDEQEVEWQDTGVYRSNKEEGDDRQQTTICGHIRWVEAGDSTWTDTGETRCKDNKVEKKQVNLSGHIRWEETDKHCGYFATMALPCEGFAFRPGEEPPDAEVEMEDCDGDTIGFLYEEPREGATTAVTTGCKCGEGDVIGYAINGKAEDCGPIEVEVKNIEDINSGKLKELEERIAELEANN